MLWLKRDTSSNTINKWKPFKWPSINELEHTQTTTKWKWLKMVFSIARFAHRPDIDIKVAQKPLQVKYKMRDYCYYLIFIAISFFSFLNFEARCSFAFRVFLVLLCSFGYFVSWITCSWSVSMFNYSPPAPCSLSQLCAVRFWAMCHVPIVTNGFLKVSFLLSLSCSSLSRALFLSVSL